jgi:ABC-type phosphate/phosphonate transport system substrate-binding protein
VRNSRDIMFATIRRTSAVWRAAALARHASSAPSPPKFPAVDPSVGATPKLEARRAAPRSNSKAILVGTVCYSESTASIWKGIMRHFGRCGLDVETVLFTSYERLNTALLARFVHVAWNSPLSHARLLRACSRDPAPILALGMRDSDRDFTSYVVVREDAGITSVADLAHRRVAAGTVDSPQAYIMPFAALKAAGVPLSTLTVTRFDRDVGKHGDTAHGETAVLEALRSGAAEAGFISKLMWDRFVKDGSTAGLVVLPGVVPPFVRPHRARRARERRATASPSLPPLPRPSQDHCQFSALETHDNRGRARAFQKAILAMDGTGHAEDAATLALEGVRERWLPPRGGLIGSDSSIPPPDPKLGYEGMLAALDAFNANQFTWPGHLHTPQQHPFKHLIIDSALVRDSFGC